VREPEERQAVAAAAVEEEVLAQAARQFQRLDQRHSENAGVEVDGALHVGRHERQMVDAAELELGVAAGHETSSERDRGRVARRGRALRRPRPGGAPAADLTVISTFPMLGYCS